MESLPSGKVYRKGAFMHVSSGPVSFISILYYCHCPCLRRQNEVTSNFQVMLKFPENDHLPVFCVCHKLWAKCDQLRHPKHFNPAVLLPGKSVQAGLTPQISVFRVALKEDLMELPMERKDKFYALTIYGIKEWNACIILFTLCILHKLHGCLASVCMFLALNYNK